MRFTLRSLQAAPVAGVLQIGPLAALGDAAVRAGDTRCRPALDRTSLALVPPQVALYHCDFSGTTCFSPWTKIVMGV